MAMRSTPTGRQLRLGVELRKMREQAGLTSTQAAQLLGIRQNQLSNIEAGRHGVSPERLHVVAKLYRCPDTELIEALSTLSPSRKRGWWEEYRDILPNQLLDLAELEHHAKRSRNGVTLHIPGLFQTTDYAREIFRQGVPEMPPPDIEHRVSFRIKRQAVLYRDRPTPLHAVMHEAALRMTIGGPKVTRAQLQRVLGMSERDHITVQVIPFSAGALPGSGQSFFYSEGPVPPLDTVHLDTSHGPVFLYDEPQLRNYRQLFEHMESAALSPEDSRDFIQTIVREL